MQSETLLESSKVKMAALSSCVCVQRSGNFLSGCQCAFVARHSHIHQQTHTPLEALRYTVAKSCSCSFLSLSFSSFFLPFLITLPSWSIASLSSLVADFLMILNTNINTLFISLTSPFYLITNNAGSKSSALVCLLPCYWQGVCVSACIFVCVLFVLFVVTYADTAIDKQTGWQGQGRERRTDSSCVLITTFVTATATTKSLWGSTRTDNTLYTKRRHIVWQLQTETPLNHHTDRLTDTQTDRQTPQRSSLTVAPLPASSLTLFCHLQHAADNCHVRFLAESKKIKKK